MVHINARDDRLQVDDLDFSLTTAKSRHRGLVQKVSSITLLQSPQYDAELGIGQNTSQRSQNRRIDIITQTAGQQTVRSGGRNRGPSSRTARERSLWIGRRGSPAVGRSSTSSSDGFSANNHVAKIPVKSQSAAVVLGNFDELGFDIDLRRGDVEHLKSFFDDVQILLSSAHEQSAFTIVEEHSLGCGHVHTNSDEEIANRHLDTLHGVGAGNTIDTTAAGSAATLAADTTTARSARSKCNTRNSENATTALAVLTATTGVTATATAAATAAATTAA